jgi:hypothetical protein
VDRERRLYHCFENGVGKTWEVKVTNKRKGKGKNSKISSQPPHKFIIAQLGQKRKAEVKNPCLKPITVKEVPNEEDFACFSVCAGYPDPGYASSS